MEKQSCELAQKGSIVSYVRWYSIHFISSFDFVSKLDF
jgi:hypothetical protein